MPNKFLAVVYTHAQVCCCCCLLLVVAAAASTTAFDCSQISGVCRLSYAFVAWQSRLAVVVVVSILALHLPLAMRGAVVVAAVACVVFALQLVTFRRIRKKISISCELLGTWHFWYFCKTISFFCFVAFVFVYVFSHNIRFEHKNGPKNLHKFLATICYNFSAQKMSQQFLFCCRIFFFFCFPNLAKLRNYENFFIGIFASFWNIWHLRWLEFDFVQRPKKKFQGKNDDKNAAVTKQSEKCINLYKKATFLIFLCFWFLLLLFLLFWFNLLGC